MNIHGLLVGDDLDPALDLRDVSISFALRMVGAPTSGMLAVLQGVTGEGVGVWRLRDCRRVVRAAVDVRLARPVVWRSGTSARRSATALCLAAINQARLQVRKLLQQGMD